MTEQITGNKQDLNIPKDLYNEILYIACNRGMTRMQILVEWKRLLQTRPEKVNSILDLQKQKSELKPFSHEIFLISLSISKLILQLFELPEMSLRTLEMYGLEPDSLSKILSEIIEIHGALILPADLQIDFNNKQQAETILGKYLRDLRKEKIH